jgi:lysophospholipase L1-like esterase
VARTRGWLPVVLVAALVGAAVILLGLRVVPTPHTPGLGAAPAPSGAGHRAWNVVGLGDSITSGQGCPGCVPFVDLYAQQITRTTSLQATVTNLGVGGWTSSDLLTSLSDRGPNSQHVRDSDIIIVTIGANDFLPMLDTALRGDCGGADGLSCFGSALTVLRDNLTAILHRIQQLRAGQLTAVRVTGYWNVFLDGTVAARTYGPSFQRSSSTLTQHVNGVIQEVAQEQGAQYVDLYIPFKGEAGDDDDTPLLADDGDHPNQAGHQEIADSLTQAGYAPLRIGP